MDSERDFSLYCEVDSDLPSKGMPPRQEADTSSTDRSANLAQLGYVVYFAGAAIEAVSRRQHSTATDTAAAELFAASVAAAILVSIKGILTFLSFGELGNNAVRVWCDNEAAVMVSKDATSIKRLAYIARRCRFLQELGVMDIVALLNVDGKANPADALTKDISPKTRFREYMARMYNCQTSDLGTTTTSS